MQTITQEYLDGIQEGRKIFKGEGVKDARAHLDNLIVTCRRFGASSPVGQMLRGERDFWRNQLRKRK